MKNKKDESDFESSSDLYVYEKYDGDLKAMNQAFLTDEDVRQKFPEDAKIADELHAQEVEFSVKVSDLMTKKGIDVPFLAEKIGYSEIFIKNILNCQTRPLKKTIAKIANIFEVDPKTLFFKN